MNYTAVAGNALRPLNCLTELKGQNCSVKPCMQLCRLQRVAWCWPACRCVASTPYDGLCEDGRRPLAVLSVPTGMLSSAVGCARQYGSSHVLC